MGHAQYGDYLKVAKRVHLKVLILRKSFVTMDVEGC